MSFFLKLFLYLVLQWQQIWTFNPFLMLKAFICLTYCRPYLTSRGERDIWSFHFDILKSIQTEMWSVTFCVQQSDASQQKEGINWFHAHNLLLLRSLSLTSGGHHLNSQGHYGCKHSQTDTFFFGIFKCLECAKTVLTGSYNWRFFPGRCKQRTQHTANGWAIEGLIAVI